MCTQINHASEPERNRTKSVKTKFLKKKSFLCFANVETPQDIYFCGNFF